jgi:hypothetical protein
VLSAAALLLMSAPSIQIRVKDKQKRAEDADGEEEDDDLHRDCLLGKLERATRAVERTTVFHQQLYAYR